jgi:hypothetical protein
MEIICIDDNFTSEQKSFYSVHNVSIPKINILYTPRSISRNSNGDWEILLVEIVNKEVPIIHPILGLAFKEPAWASRRFSKLDGSQLTEEEIREFIKKEKHVEKFA